MDIDDVSLNDFDFFDDSVSEVFDDLDSFEVDISDFSNNEILVYSDSVSDNDVSGGDYVTLLSNLSEDSADYTEYLVEIESGLREINTNLNIIIGVALLWLAFYFSKRLINLFKE